MKKSILASGLLFTLGSLLVQGLSFFTLPLYTNLLSQEVYGKFSLYSSWVTLVGLFIGLQLQGSFGAAKIRFEEKFDAFVSTSLGASILLFLPVFAGSFLFRPFLSQVFSIESSFVPWIFFQAFALFLVALLNSYWVQKQKTLGIFLLSLLNALLSTALSLVLILKMENDFFARFLAQLLVAASFALFAVFYFFKKTGFFIQKEYFVFALQISVPLIFHHLGHHILNQFDRIMIGKMLQLSDVALYSFAYTLSSVLQLVFSSMNTVWCPWYFEKKRAEDKDLLKFVHRYLHIGLFLTLGFLTIYPELALLLGGEKYRESLNYIPLLVLGYFFVFLYSFPANIQFYHANTKFLPVGTLVAGVANILMNAWMIPFWHVSGAAFATALSYLLLLALHYVLVRKRYDYKEIRVFLFVKMILAAGAYTMLMQHWAASLPLRWFAGFLVLSVYLFCFRKELHFIKNLKIGKKKN